MSHTVSESDAYSASVTVPDPGDLVEAINLEAAVQPIANRTKNHEAHGLWDSVKSALGSALVYRLKSTGGIELLSAGNYILGTISELRGAWSVVASWSFTKAVSFDGVDARVKWRNKDHTDANSDIDTSADEHFLPNTITASRVRTVRTTGTYTPLDGQRVKVVRTRPTGSYSGLYSESVTSETGQALFVFGVGYHGFVWLTYRSSINDWVPTSWGNVDGSSLTGSGLYGN